MKKKLYEQPNLDFTVMSAEDILTSSEDLDDNQGEWDELSAFAEE